MIDPAPAGSHEPSTTPVGMMAAAARGDVVAFGSLYDATAPAVWGLVHQLSSSAAQAEAVLHEVFLDAWRRAPSLADAGVDPAEWLCDQARLRCETPA